MGCFSVRLMSAASDQKFCKLCSLFCCSFDEFVEDKVISPSYSSAILTPPPEVKALETNLDEIIKMDHHCGIIILVKGGSDMRSLSLSACTHQEKAI